MLWWWKLQLESPDGVTRQQAIEELTTSLGNRDETRQRNAAKLLATIGHPRAVNWALNNTSNERCAEWSMWLLNQIVAGFAHAVEPESLRAIAELADPMQKTAAAPLGPNGKPRPGIWETYRCINCTELRQKAAMEIQRREYAEAQWRKADEAVQERRSSLGVIRKSA
jgi:hypothetical protein